MRLKILTVDDSKTIRMIVAKALKPFECEVFEAANGVEGLAVASREQPDLIVLDLTMPIMDGVEMLSKLKSKPELKAIPVIMLTAEAGRENVLKIARMGVRDYLIKPFKEELLIERISRVVELKPKGESTSKIRRFDDPISLLVVDDKPAICELLKEGLADIPWTVVGRSQGGEAVDYCSQALPDVILVSLSLPDSAGYTLFQMLRASNKTKNVPIFGMCVKTAIDDQAKAQQAGFSGLVTKPIDFEDLKSKIARSLSLDTSYKYFVQTNGSLLLKLPSSFTQSVANDVNIHLRNQVSDAVDAGINKMIIDLSQVQKPEINLIKLGLAAIELCKELSLKQRMVGSDSVRSECKNFEETKDWKFESSFEEALASFSNAALASAA